MPEEQTGPGPRWIGEKPRKRYSVVLDPEVKEKAQAAAKAEGLSFSMWMENAARELLPAIEKQRDS